MKGIVGNKTQVKRIKRLMTGKEKEEHLNNDHHPYDLRCKHCLLGGIKERQHFRRKRPRDENVLAIDVAGRFRSEKGPEGQGYKYMLVATLRGKDIQVEKRPKG